MRRIVRFIPRPIRNRYGAVVLGLLGWIMFFDRNDLWTNWKHQRELDRTVERTAWYDAEIERTREQLRELGSDPALLEKFARERYLMKRADEDIFVLVPAQE
ncbi:MAG: hypothetical protein RBT71_01805 [Flavobacteriales bacterium]|jgi:cell division protein FtsB|nr:hypothetical protein [Flavobacteriales bacterium]